MALRVRVAMPLSLAVREAASASWGTLAPNCNAAYANRVASTPEYAACGNATGFSFDLAVVTPTAPVDENAFCHSTSCLALYRVLQSTAGGAVLFCANVPGLELVRLDTLRGAYSCFGEAAASGRSDVIVRAGDSSSGSGSGDDALVAPSTSVRTPPSRGKLPVDVPQASTVTRNVSGGENRVLIASIVGISIAALAVVVILLCRYHRRRRNQSPHTDGDTITDEQLTTQYSSLGPQKSRALPAFIGTGFDAAFADWDEDLITAVRIPYEKLTFDELMSRGGYGEVYRGTYRGELVAIKTLLPERRRDMKQIQSFLAEIKMMSGMEHERIARFIGVAWDSLEELSVVSEFLARGDLRTVLSEFEKDHSRPHGFNADKVKIALHVAHGLTYMHTLQPIVLHRDLKSRNILLDAELNAKITDFGVSRERSDRTMTAGVGSSLWMAPEVMMGERYDEKADIFSFGVVLSELDNHVLPYSHAVERTSGRRIASSTIVQMVSLGRVRVAFTDEATSEMAQIGLKCVALAPKDRPTAAELLHLIHQVWRRYSPTSR